MLNPAIKVKINSEIEGSGLVADRFIPAGEVIFRFDDTKPPVHHYEIVNWPPEKRIRFLAFACQIGEDDFSFQQGDIKYINHSCDPTAWWENYGTLTARRDINEGEEVAYDYSTSDITLNYKMKCLCGSNSCRGLVTNKDYLNHDFQTKYANHLPSHVVEAIRRYQTDEADPRIKNYDEIPEQIILAARQTRLEASEYKRRYGNQHIFEMVKQAIEQVVSDNPELRNKYGDKYIYESVRQVILKG